MPSPSRFSVVFVCTGNICRSPMADVVFRKIVADAGFSSVVSSSSAGTGDWHVGERADHRTLDALERNGYDGAAHRARQFQASELQSNDLVVALDRSHERILRHWAPDESAFERISLLRSFEQPVPSSLDVPDPYYGDQHMFDEVLAMVERSTRALFDQLRPALPRSV